MGFEKCKRSIENKRGLDKVIVFKALVANLVEIENLFLDEAFFTRLKKTSLIMFENVFRGRGIVWLS